MEIVRDEDHSNGAPTLKGTGIRVVDIAEAYEHSGYDPDEITELYPALSLSDVHTGKPNWSASVREFYQQLREEKRANWLDRQKLEQERREVLQELNDLELDDLFEDFV